MRRDQVLFPALGPAESFETLQGLAARLHEMTAPAFGFHLEPRWAEVEGERRLVVRIDLSTAHAARAHFGCAVLARCRDQGDLALALGNLQLCDRRRAA